MSACPECGQTMPMVEPRPETQQEAYARHGREYAAAMAETDEHEGGE